MLAAVKVLVVVSEELYDLQRDPAREVNRVRRDRYADVRLDLLRQLRGFCNPLPHAT